MIYLGHCYVTENQHKSNSKAKRKDQVTISLLKKKGVKIMGLHKILTSLLLSLGKHYVLVH